MAGSTNLVLEGILNGTSGANYSISQATDASAAAAAAAEETATLSLISSLVFANSKSIRTSTMILAAFNALAAFITAGSILYDCYWASKRCNPKFKASKFCVSSIHPAETFPLVIALGIMIQGLVFIGVQGTGLSALDTTGCSLIAQFMWPALFIPPYLQAVFGVECAIRSLRRLPFQARGKYDVTICLGVVFMMLIGTWIPSHITPEADLCFASLLYYVADFGLWGLVLFASMTVLMILSAITIFWRLSNATMVDQHQRIAASRMVYYLVMGIVALAFVIPYFASQVISGGDFKTSMMATVVLNLSGLMTGLMHMFLRTNTTTSSFGPKIGKAWDRQKHEIKIFGPNELAFRMHLADPVSGPDGDMDFSSRTSSIRSLLDLEKSRPYSLESVRGPAVVLSPTIYNPLKSNAVEMKPVEVQVETTSRSTSRGPGRKQSYSMFPKAQEPASPGHLMVGHARQQDPVSVYDITQLQPPASVFGGAHRRNASTASSATVQIGIRFSHAPPSEEDMQNLPLPSTTYNAKSSRPASPLKVQTNNFSFPQQQQQSIPIPPKSPRRPSPLANDSPACSPTAFSPTAGLSPEQMLQRMDSLNKTLPRTPKGSLVVPTSSFSRLAGSTTQLTPAVYTPEKSTTPKPVVGLPSSPKRVEQLVAPPQRSNSGRLIAPPQRSNSGRQLAPGAKKGEWI